MAFGSLRLDYLLLVLLSQSGAKVINTDATSSYVEKVRVGVAQAMQWMADAVSTAPARQPRQVELAVVGFGRTGSTSFVTALKALGYTPIHDDEVSEVADVYGGMMRGTLSLDEVNAELGRRGFDTPVVGTHDYVRWAAAQPDLKVVLTTRDKTKWAQSWLAITPVAFLPEQRPFKWVPMFQEMAAFQIEIMVNVPTNGKPDLYEDIPTLEAGFEAWETFVRATVPKERLLVFDVKQGWAPLCEFLGKPVPDTTFPHINDRVVVDTIVKVFQLVAWIWPLLLASPFLILWCCCSRCCRGKHLSTEKKKQ